MSQFGDAKVHQPNKVITMVLLGLNNNKCMIGNTIFQEYWLSAEKEKHSMMKQVNDRSINIINTPDNLHWPIPKPEATSEEELNTSDPRVFLLVLQEKMSEDEIKMFEHMKRRFGEKMVENTIVVLIRDEEERSEEECSEEPYERAKDNLKKVLDECGKRVCVHKKNQDMKESELRKELMEIYDKMQSSNTAFVDHTYETVDDIELMKMMQKDESKGDYITVVLVGKNNDDKCLIGNIILQKERFQPENDTFQTNMGEVADQSVLIIKTPDSFHTDPNSDMMKEMNPSYTGPRVFLLILQENEVSQEEMTMMKKLKRRFGEKMVENTVVLVDREKLSLHSMENFIVNFTKEILDECGNRVCYYNRDIKNNKLVKELMKYAEEIMQSNQVFKYARKWTYENVPPSNNPMEPILPPNTSVHKKYLPAATTIVLLGQTGSGKSASGNTILGQRCFESYASSVPVTQECQKAEGTVSGMKIRVIDTPDFFNEDLKNQEEELRRCKDLIQDGSVVYLLVMELGRFTDGEREVLPRLKKEFGEDMTMKIVILFTNQEKLKNKSLKDYINETDEELQQMIRTCDSRCYAFNNNKKSGQQVKELMDIILNMQTDGNMPMMKSSHHKRQTNKPKDGKNCRIL